MTSPPHSTGRMGDGTAGQRRSRASEFVIFVALPLLLTAFAMTAGANWLLSGIARSVNAQEEKRSWEAVQSGMGSRKDRLVGIAADNVYWDDAARALYGTVDEAWFENMLGVGSVNYDTVFLLSPEGQALLAYHQNARFETAPGDYLGPLLEKITAFATSGKKEFDTLATLASTPDGPSIVVAAPVMPYSEGSSIPQRFPNIVVLIDQLNAETVAKLGRQYIVDDLKIVPATAGGQNPHVLTDLWNQPVAVASWTHRNPGEIAQASYRSWALGLPLGLLCVLVPLTIIYFRRLGELEKSQHQALFAARHDALTGLLGRNAFVDDLDAMLKASPGTSAALMLINVSDIRDINDRFGLGAGDEVIRTLTGRLISEAGERALLGRFGGSTFALAFTGAGSLARAEETAARVVAALAAPLQMGAEEMKLSVSAGIGADAAGQAHPSELAHRADLALYYASTAGSNQWRRFETALDVSGP